MMVILANTITSDMGMIPGLAFCGPAMGLPLSVLASFIERPFYTRGGVTSNAIWYSLQANLLSLAIGFAALIAGGLIVSPFINSASSADAALIILWPFCAVTISTVFERNYIKFRSPDHQLRWRPAITANVVSASACVVILIAVIFVRQEYPASERLFRPAQNFLTYLALAGSLLLFAIAFLKTRRRKHIDVTVPNGIERSPV